MVCKKCGNEILEGEKFCGKCGTKVQSSFYKAEKVITNANDTLTTKSRLIIILIIILVIGGIITCSIAFFTNRNRTSGTIYEDSKIDIHKKEAKFKSMEDLENISLTTNWITGQAIKLNGLDIIAKEAIMEKTSKNINNSIGKSNYEKIITSYQTPIFVGFKINDEVIGGLVVFIDKDEATIGRTYTYSGGYYKTCLALAIKVTDWNSFDTIRLRRI